VKREAVLGMLVSWQREGIVEHSGVGMRRLLNGGRLLKPSLLPDMARALEWERDSDVLLFMAGYVPGAAEVSAHPEAARGSRCPVANPQSGHTWRARLAAWVARWNLWRARVMTDREQAQFHMDYAAAVGAESNGMVLVALAQTGPPGSFPLTAWGRHLSDGDDACRLAAHLAIHGWLVNMASSEWRVARSECRPHPGLGLMGLSASPAGSVYSDERSFCQGVFTENASLSVNPCACASSCRRPETATGSHYDEISGGTALYDPAGSRLCWRCL
jgi:hypothetical protein